MRKGFVIAEEAHVVQALAPVDINGGVNSDVWSMENHAHATILVALGVTGGATTVTVEECARDLQDGPGTASGGPVERHHAGGCAFSDRSMPIARFHWRDRAG